MPFTLTIIEHTTDTSDGDVERIKLTVEDISINAVFLAATTPPKKSRVDKGVTRGPKTAPAATV